MRANVDPLPADAPPNWDRLPYDVCCPRCGYNLKLLAAPRCPECGLRSTWRELVAAAKARVVSPLFEYQWRRRPVRSFFRTLGESMLPWMIWQTATLTARPRITPLIVMLFLTLVLGAATFILIAIGIELSDTVNRVTGWPRIPLASVALTGCEWSLRIGAMHLLPALCLLVSAMVLQQTLHAYRIRPGHLVRVTLLTVVGMVGWFMLAWCVRNFCEILLGRPPQAVIVWMERMPELLSLSCFAASSACAWTFYLRVRRGVLDAILVDVLAVALVSTVVYAVVGLSWPASLWLEILRLSEAFWPMSFRGIAWLGSAVLGLE